MISLSFKKAAIYSLLAVSALTSTTSYASSRDPMGLDKDPVCEEFDLIKETYIDEIGAKSTGRKANNGQWEMELFANSKTGAWVLLGQKKNAKPGDDVCVLAESQKPYDKEKWYLAFFQKGQNTAPKIAAAEAPKLSMN